MVVDFCLEINSHTNDTRSVVQFDMLMSQETIIDKMSSSLLGDANICGNWANFETFNEVKVCVF